MNCPICKTDISDLSKQYGNMKIPICQLCFLQGEDWITENPEILELLAAGETLENAMIIENSHENKELTLFFLEEMHNISLSIMKVEATK